MTNRKQVRKNRSALSSAWMWFFSGLLSGLLLMTLALQSGLIRMPRNLQQAMDRNEAALLEETAIIGNQSDTQATGRNDDARQYDFFQILPEQETVVPESEVRRQANRAATNNPDSNETYILQVASLRSASDADALKARLLLLGMDTSIVKVDVNGETWHRVRVGPLADARQASDMRNKLTSNGFDAMIIKSR